MPLYSIFHIQPLSGAILVLTVMASPSKRRRKNDFQPSSQPVKSLDFFFSKQKTAQAAREVLNKPKGSETEVLEDVVTSSTPLTDQELARQLQEEWNQEDYKSVDNGVPSQIGTSAQDHTSVGQAPEARGVDADSSGPQVVNEKAILSLQSVASSEDDITTCMPFDDHPLTFDPQEYIPRLKKCWEATGNDASYGILSHAFVLINSTKSRIKIVDTLTNFLRTLIEGNPGSLLSAVCYYYPKLLAYANSSLGLAHNKRYIPTIHKSRARIRRLFHIESSSKGLWSQTRRPEGLIRQAWRRWGCCV